MSKPIFGIKGTNQSGYCIAFDEIEKIWCVHEMPSKALVQRYHSLPNAFARVGAECERRINQDPPTESLKGSSK
jgi:hypothetical protein